VSMILAQKLIYTVKIANSTIDCIRPSGYALGATGLKMISLARVW